MEREPPPEGWIWCDEAPIAADVVRFTDGVWKRAKKKGGKARLLGKREVVAEIVYVDKDDWVSLLVLQSEGKYPLQEGEEIRRQLSTVLRFGCQRLLWSDETARADLVEATDESSE